MLTFVQMFRIFFSHLTTSIAEMEVYLCDHTTHRDLIPTDSKQLPAFKTLADKANEALIGGIAGSSTAAAAKGKAKGKKRKKAAEKEEGGPGSAEFFLQKLGVELVNFGHRWRTLFELMPLFPFTRDNRTAKDRGERMLTMSGLSWNPKSQNKTRDWGNIVAAITIETIVVESYREDLLQSCSGACTIREEAYAYFLSHAVEHYKRANMTSRPEMVTEWVFADAYNLDVGARGGKQYNSADLRKYLDTAHATTTRMKKDPIRTWVEGIEKNKLLWSSDDGAGKGSVETLAHHCISTLAHVSQLFRVSDLPTHRHERLVIVSFRSCIATQDGSTMGN